MHYVVSSPLGPRIAEQVGKKTSEGSISFYSRKAGDATVTCLAPANIQEKFYAAIESMLMSSCMLIDTSQLNSLFGEVLIAASLLNRRVIFSEDNDVSQIVKPGMLQSSEVSSAAEMAQKATSANPAYPQSPARVELDSAFSVRGIGTVALGIVTSGTVKVHDTLYHSSGKQVSVRSIQSMDVDFQEAPAGMRVGLALKGIEDKEMDKGDVLCSSLVKKANSVKVRLTRSRLVSEEMSEGKSYWLVSGFSNSRAMVESVDGATATLKLERGLSVAPGDIGILMRDAVPRPFALCEIV